MSADPNQTKPAVKNVWLSAPILIGYILTALIIGFWLVIFFHTPECNSKPCYGNWNNFWNQPLSQIGDTFAGLFGSLAFVWIVVTVMLQGQELRAQREELTLNRKESKKMAGALEEQVFDNSFFAMLTTFNSIIADIDVGRDDDKNGRDAFVEFYNSLHYVNSWEGPRLSKIENTETFAKPLERYFQDYSKELSHYFRFLFRILTTLEQKDRVDSYHAKLLRAQLSDYELIIIFYNCLTKNGEPFIALAEKFAIFDNIPTEKILNIEHCSALNAEAFGSNRGYWKWHESKNS